MAALFNDSAFCHQTDAIHMLQALQSVRHHNHGFITAQALEQRQNLLFRLGIEAFGWLIQQPNRTVVQ